MTKKLYPFIEHQYFGENDQNQSNDNRLQHAQVEIDDEKNQWKKDESEVIEQRRIGVEPERNRTLVKKNPAQEGVGQPFQEQVEKAYSRVCAQQDFGRDMLYEGGVRILEVAEQADTRKYACLQYEQQQIAHVGCRGRGEYAATFAVQQEVLHQLHQQFVAVRKDVCRQEKAAQQNHGDAVVHPQGIGNGEPFRPSCHPSRQQFHHIAANLRMEASHRGMV